MSSNVGWNGGCQCNGEPKSRGTQIPPRCCALQSGKRQSTTLPRLTTPNGIISERKVPKQIQDMMIILATKRASLMSMGMMRRSFAKQKMNKRARPNPLIRGAEDVNKDTGKGNDLEEETRAADAANWQRSVADEVAKVMIGVPSDRHVLMRPCIAQLLEGTEAVENRIDRLYNLCRAPEQRPESPSSAQLERIREHLLEARHLLRNQRDSFLQSFLHTDGIDVKGTQDLQSLLRQWANDQLVALASIADVMQTSEAEHLRSAEVKNGNTHLPAAVID